MTLLTGKRGLIMGIANDHSIAYGIAKCCAEAGAELALTYQNDMLAKRVRPLGAELGARLTLPCDVGSEGSINDMVKTLKKEWEQIDFVVHAIAFADKAELRGAYLTTSRKISTAPCKSHATR